MDPEHDPVEGMLGMVGWTAPWAALVFALALCMSRNTSRLFEQAAGLNAPAKIWDTQPRSQGHCYLHRRSSCNCLTWTLTSLRAASASSGLGREWRWLKRQVCIQPSCVQPASPACSHHYCSSRHARINFPPAPVAHHTLLQTGLVDVPAAVLNETGVLGIRATSPKARKSGCQGCA